MRKLIGTFMLVMAVAAVSAQENVYSFKVKSVEAAVAQALKAE